ncbi:MAG: type II/IV secretion system ATPase subunit [Candidatus Aenigmatarchaeota archaeon]
MKIVLRRPPKKVNLYKVFHKAVDGYKNLQKRAMENMPHVQLLSSMIGEPPQPGAYGPMPGLKPHIGLGKTAVEKIAEEEKESDIIKKKTPLAFNEPEVNLKSINIVYTLIQSEERVPLASANIKWSRTENSLIYYLIEPVLNDSEKNLLKRIKTAIMEKLDIDFTSMRKGEARTYLKKRFEETIDLMTAELPVEKRKQFLYYVERDFVGMDKIEPMMQDPNIEDISCDGIGIPLFVFHRNPVLGSIQTNVKFESKEELDTFVSKVAQRCGKNISIAVPLIGGSLPDGSRVQATLGTDIARRGSNFTIRKFTKRPLTPIQLINFKTIDPKIAAFLWLSIEYGRSILMSGGVASGKNHSTQCTVTFHKA